MINHSAPYQLWLNSHHYSPVTIKNYLLDLNRYLNFIKGADPFSIDSITAFIKSIKNDPNKNRYTSSLSKFLQFAQDQKLISSNPIKKIKSQFNKPENDLEEIVSKYQTFLTKKNFSLATIKNYLNDIQQFISWDEKENPPVKLQDKGFDESK